MKKNSIFEEYIKSNKGDIIVYFIILVVVSIILFIIGKKTKFYYIMLLNIFLINSFIFKINTKYVLLRIEKYVYKNNMNNKLGNIEYWNEYNYFLTENYIIIAEKKDVFLVDYNDIKYMYYKNDVHLSQFNSYVDKELYIVLKNNKKFKFLVSSTLLTNEKLKDLGSYLISKNKNIEILESDYKK